MKFYFDAEKFVDANQKGSLKNRIFNSKHDNPKHIYAVVYSTLKYKEYIDQIIKKSKLKDAMRAKKTKVSENVLRLLVHDLLFSPKGRIQSGKHPLKEAFLLNRARLLAEFTKLKLKYKAKLVDQLPVANIDEDETPVRWVRINKIKTTEDAFFKKHLVLSLTRVNSLDELTGPGLVYHDEHVPGLYGVHPKEKITASNAYTDGELIIQDRASCFPAVILNNDPDDVHTEVIDACAAPGNKTTHEAAHLAENGGLVVYAFERDAHRVKTLKTMCDRATGNHKDLIQITHADFTTTKHADFPSVTGLIVDPLCSGLGIFGRAIENQEQDNELVDEDRLNKLAAFQVAIMKHALAFPGARKVVYSTCSIHPHENERVVVDLLTDPQVKEQGWTLADREVVLPLWPRRGWADEFSKLSREPEVCEKLAGGCVRAQPREDGGIGFFAACFVKDNEIK